MYRSFHLNGEGKSVIDAIDPELVRARRKLSEAKDSGDTDAVSKWERRIKRMESTDDGASAASTKKSLVKRDDANVDPELKRAERKLKDARESGDADEIAKWERRHKRLSGKD